MKRTKQEVMAALIASLERHEYDQGQIASITDETTPAEIGFDSLDMVEMMLDLEEAFPDLDLEEYQPTEKATFGMIAEHIAGLSERNA